MKASAGRIEVCVECELPKSGGPLTLHASDTAWKRTGTRQTFKERTSPILEFWMFSQITWGRGTGSLRDESKKIPVLCSFYPLSDQINQPSQHLGNRASSEYISLSTPAWPGPDPRPGQTRKHNFTASVMEKCRFYLPV